MVVLQFGFDPGDMGSVHNPWNHVEQRVVYTGTHDHDTVRGWYESMPARAARAGRPLRRRGRRARGRAVVVADPPGLRLPARVAMVQAQDVLGLGGEARMNVPGTKGGSWRWALSELPRATSRRA